MVEKSKNRASLARRVNDITKVKQNTKAMANGKVIYLYIIVSNFYVGKEVYLFIVANLRQLEVSIVTVGTGLGDNWVSS